MPIARKITDEVISKLGLSSGSEFAYIKLWGSDEVNPSIQVSITPEQNTIGGGGHSIDLRVTTSEDFALGDITWTLPSNFSIDGGTKLGKGNYLFTLTSNTTEASGTNVDIDLRVGNTQHGFKFATETLTVDREDPSITCAQDTAGVGIVQQFTEEFNGTWSDQYSQIERITIWYEYDQDGTKRGAKEASINPDGTWTAQITFPEPRTGVFVSVEIEDTCGNTTVLADFKEYTVATPAAVGEIVVEGQPNENGWYNQTVQWAIKAESDYFTADYKVWKDSESEPAGWTSASNPFYVDGSNSSVFYNVSSEGRWNIRVRIISKTNSSDIFYTETEFNLDPNDPVWTSPDAGEISGFGAVKFDWNSENISSFSGGNEILIRIATVNDYSQSEVIDVVSSENSSYQHNDLSDGAYYFFFDVRSAAGNVATNILSVGALTVEDLVPSNLREELAVIEDGVSGVYYQFKYGLSHRIDTIELITSSVASIQSVEYLNTSGSWVSVSGLEIDDNTSPTLPFGTTATFRHEVFFDKVSTKGVRIEFASTTEAGYVTEFNPVEKLAAETFIGQTFEVQRGIKFTNESGNQRMAFDDFGLRGWKDYTNFPNSPTFQLSHTDAYFMVGYQGYGAKPDSYAEFDPDANSGDGLFKVVGRGEFEEGLIGGWEITQTSMENLSPSGGMRITTDSGGSPALKMFSDDGVNSPVTIQHDAPEPTANLINSAGVSSVTFANGSAPATQTSDVYTVQTSEETIEVEFTIQDTPPPEPTQGGFDVRVTLQINSGTSGSPIWEDAETSYYTVEYNETITDYLSYNTENYVEARLEVELQSEWSGFDGSAGVTSITFTEYEGKIALTNKALYIVSSPNIKAVLGSGLNEIVFTGVEQETVQWTSTKNKPFSTVDTTSGQFQIVSDQLKLPQGLGSGSNPVFADLEVSSMKVNTSSFSGSEIARFNGDVLIDGGLDIGGTINYMNEQNLQVEDRTITVNKNGTDGSAEGAGIIIERPSGNETLLWDSTSGFDFSDPITAGKGTFESYTTITASAGLVTGNDAVFRSEQGSNWTEIRAQDGSSLGDLGLRVRGSTDGGGAWTDIFEARGDYISFRGTTIFNSGKQQLLDTDANVTFNQGTFSGLLTAQAGIESDDWIFIDDPSGSDSRLRLRLSGSDIGQLQVVSGEMRIAGTSGARLGFWTNGVEQGYFQGSDGNLILDNQIQTSVGKLTDIHRMNQDVRTSDSVEFNYGHFTGSNSPTSGAGVEIGWTGTLGKVLAYDRDTASYQQLDLRGSTVNIEKGPVNIVDGLLTAQMGVTSNGDIVSNGNYYTSLNLGTVSYGEPQVILIGLVDDVGDQSVSGTIRGISGGSSHRGRFIIDVNACTGDGGGGGGMLLNYSIRQEHDRVPNVRVVTFDYSGNSYLGIELYGTSSNWYPEKWNFTGYFYSGGGEDLQVLNTSSVSNVQAFNSFDENSVTRHFSDRTVFNGETDITGLLTAQAGVDVTSGDVDIQSGQIQTSVGQLTDIYHMNQPVRTTDDVVFGEGRFNTGAGSFFIEPFGGGSVGLRSSGFLALITPDASDIVFENDSGTRFAGFDSASSYIDTSFAVNTNANEGYTLNVNGTSQFKDDVDITSAGNTTLTIEKTGGGGFPSIFFADDGVNDFGIVDDQPNSRLEIRNSSNDLVHFGQAGNIYLQPENAGNVGINASTPDNKLHINNGGQVGTGNRNDYAFGAGSETQKILIGYETDVGIGLITAVENGVSFKDISFPHSDVVIGDTATEGYTLNVNGTAQFKSDITYLTKLASDNYSSGILGSGSILDNDASGGAFFEVDNARVRNEFRAHIFKKDIVRVSNGYRLGTDSAQVHQDVTLSDNTSEQTIKIDSGSGNATFSVGDLIWAKSISDDGTTIYGVKAEVTAIDTAPSDHTVLTVDTSNGGNGGTIKDGDVIARVSGGYLFEDASSQFSPFLDVYNGVVNWTDFQNSDKLKARYGNLSGAPTLSDGTVPNGYGLYSENVFLEGTIVANNGIIGGWDINSNYIQSPNDSIWMGVSDNNSDDEIRISADGTGTGGTNFVRMYHDNASTYGIEVIDDNFEIVHLGEEGGASANRISGWEVNSDRIVDSENVIEIDSAGQQFKISPSSVDSNGNDYVRMFFGSTSNWGLEGKVGNEFIFQLGDENIIAGWALTNTEISANNLTLNSSGQITNSVQLNGNNAYQFNNTGEGWVSGKAVEWDTDGNLFFDKDANIAFRRFNDDEYNNLWDTKYWRVDSNIENVFINNTFNHYRGPFNEQVKRIRTPFGYQDYGIKFDWGSDNSWVSGVETSNVTLNDGEDYMWTFWVRMNSTSGRLYVGQEGDPVNGGDTNFYFWNENLINLSPQDATEAEKNPAEWYLAVLYIKHSGSTADYSAEGGIYRQDGTQFDSINIPEQDSLGDVARLRIGWYRTDEYGTPGSSDDFIHIYDPKCYKVSDGTPSVEDMLYGSTTIGGEFVRTGSILSSNWDGTNGTKFDLDNGRLQMGYGGSTIFDFNSAGSSAEIAGWTFNNLELRKTTADHQLRIMADSNAYSGASGDLPSIAVRDVATNAQINVGGVYGTTDEFGFALFENRDNDPYMQFSVNSGSGALTAQIAGWTFDNQTLKKSFTSPDIDVYAGVDNEGHTGFKVHRVTENDQLRMIYSDTNDYMQFLSYTNNGSDEITIGDDHRGILNSMGIRVRSQDQEVLKVDDTGAEIAGWTFTDKRLKKTTTDADLNILSDGTAFSPTNYDTKPVINIFDNANDFLVEMGNIYGRSTHSGFAVRTGLDTSDIIFEMSSDGSSNVQQIAGWNFNDKAIHYDDGTVNTVVARDATHISGSHASEPVFSTYNRDTNVMVNMGNIYKSSAYTGFAIWDDFGTDSKVFEVSTDGTNKIQQIAGWRFDSTDLWAGSSSKSSATVRLDSANGRIYYDAMVYVVFAQNELAPYNSSGEADDLDNNFWETYHSSATNGSLFSETKLKIRYYHRYGFDNLRINGYAETDNSGDSSFDNDIVVRVKDSGGTTQASNNVDIGFLNEFTLDVDISSLSIDTYYIIEIDLEAQIGNVNSGTPTAGTRLREDVTVVATT